MEKEVKMTRIVRPPLKHTQSENNHFSTQEKRIYLFLRSRLATTAMISKATGIPEISICRRKRDLEKAGKLWAVEQKACKVTGYKAWYLTTASDLAIRL